MGMPFGLLSQDVKIVPILSYQSDTASRNSEVIDTLGYSGCCVVIHNAAVHDSAAHTYKLAHSDAVTNETTLNTGADILGTSQTVLTGDNKVQYIDGRPTKRYVQLAVTGDDTQASAQSAVAYLYNGKTKPVTQALGTSAVGEGTAAVTGELTAGGWTTGTA